MKVNKQTWWDKEIKDQYTEFKSWVGTPNATSKVVIRDFIISEGYKSIVDFGCGMCDDYFEYLKIPIYWRGIESSDFLYKHTQVKEIPVINVEAHDTNLPNNTAQVAYSRHVLEHQRHYEPILSEMIRIASHIAIHIFFIPPRNTEIINWQREINLYHNTFIRKEMENFIMNNPKVNNFTWLPVTKTEEALIIKLN